MKKITDLYNYINDRLRIDERGGRFSIASFNRMIGLVQNVRYDELISAFESNLDSSNTTSKFISVDSRSISGILSFPTNFYKTSSLERLSEAKYIRCDIYTLKEWGERMRSSVDVPSDLNPMARIIGNTIEIMPAVGNVRHYYFRKLTTPSLATTVVGDENVIDDAASVDLEITDNASFERMANMMLAKMGITLENAPVAQTAVQNV